jgi:hypothetical protein
MGVTYSSLAGSIASINPANPTANSVNNALNSLITDYFSAEHEMRGHTIPTIHTTIPYNYSNEDIGSDDTISPWNTFDPEQDTIINNEPEDESVWLRADDPHIHFHAPVKHEFNKFNKNGKSGMSGMKIQRKKGYLKQPGGASCDQRR